MNASAAPGTAYCFDPLYLAHDLAGHPESRARLERIMAALEREGLLPRMRPIPPQPVDLALLAQAHTETHIARVRQMAASWMLIPMSTRRAMTRPCWPLAVWLRWSARC